MSAKIVQAFEGCLGHHRRGKAGLGTELYKAICPTRIQAHDSKLNLKFLIFDTMKLLEENKDKLMELCDSHNVKKLYLFGSILTDRFIDSSDVDFLVQFNDIVLEKYLDNYLDFKEQLELLFNRQVDLIENQAIRNPIFRRVVDREKQLVYERKNP
jgi:predicted nucleotidyltransferase